MTTAQGAEVARSMVGLLSGYLFLGIDSSALHGSARGDSVDL